MVGVWFATILLFISQAISDLTGTPVLSNSFSLASHKFLSSTRFPPGFMTPRQLQLALPDAPKVSGAWFYLDYCLHDSYEWMFLLHFQEKLSPNWGCGSINAGSTDVLCLSIPQRTRDCQVYLPAFWWGYHTTVSPGLWLGPKGNRTVSDMTSKHAQQALLGNPKCFPHTRYSG